MSSSTDAGTDPGPAPCASPVLSAPNCRLCSGPWRSRAPTLVTGPNGQLIEEPDLRHYGQRMHDALEDVCDRTAPHRHRVPDAGGTPATVIITIDIEDLLTGTGYGLTSDGTLIRTDQVRDHGRSSRGLLRVPRPQRGRTEPGPDPTHRHPRPIAALIARDGGCSFPGCDRAPEWSERHHVIPWIDGGRTESEQSDFALPLSPSQFHSRGWTGRINPDGIPEWTTTPIRRSRSETDDQHPHHRHARRPNKPAAVARLHFLSASSQSVTARVGHSCQSVVHSVETVVFTGLLLILVLR